MPDTLGTFPEVCPVVLAEPPGFALGEAAEKDGGKPDTLEESGTKRASSPEPVVTSPQNDEQRYAEVSPQVDFPEVQLSIPIEEDLGRLPDLHVEIQKAAVPAISPESSEEHAASPQICSEVASIISVSLQNTVKTPATRQSWA